METWDTRYPFSADEIGLFSRLHQKATKFAPPPNLKADEPQLPAENEAVQVPRVCESDNEHSQKYGIALQIFHFLIVECRHLKNN